MQSKRLSGFTLIEVLVVIALLGIVTALAAPGFASLVQSNRVQAAAGELQRALYYARSEAMSRGVNVALIAPNANGWAGVVVISTVSTPVMPNEEVLRQYSLGLGAANILASASVGGSGLTRLTFRPNGSLMLESSATVRICGAGSIAPGKLFTLSVGGMVAISDYRPAQVSSKECG